MQAARQRRRAVRRALLYTAVGAGAGVAGYFGWRWYTAHYGSGAGSADGSDAPSALPADRAVASNLN